MVPSSIGTVHGCLQITNAASYKIPPHKPINILTMVTLTIFAIMIWILLLLDVKTNVAVFKSNSSPKLFTAKNMIKILEKFPKNAITLLTPKLSGNAYAPYVIPPPMISTIIRPNRNSLFFSIFVSSSIVMFIVLFITMSLLSIYSHYK